MDRRRGSTVYASREAIRWLVDDDRVIVINDVGPAAHVLEGRDALIWRSLTLVRDYGKLLDLLQAISGDSDSETAQALHATLERWTELGLIAGTVDVDHG